MIMKGSSYLSPTVYVGQRVASATALPDLTSKAPRTIAPNNFMPITYRVITPTPKEQCYLAGTVDQHKDPQTPKNSFTYNCVAVTTALQKGVLINEGRTLSIATTINRRRALWIGFLRATRCLGGCGFEFVCGRP